MHKKGIVTIKNQRLLADQIYELTCTGELVTQMTTPGQFVHMRVTDHDDLLLRRPLSICDVDVANQSLTILYRVEGNGTARLAEKKSGETLDLLAPLGQGFPVEAAKQGETALLVGGGIGVPPLYYLSKQLKERGVNIVHVLGFNSVSDVFYESAFSELGSTYVTTVDGTHGSKGFVTDAIKQFDIQADVLYCCGPTPMLRALSEAYEGSRAYVSLEERIGCGVGACFACVCHTSVDPEGTDYRKVCTDGPVFKVGEVVI
ncbi:dihydroorotate dehydrogenase electron transfer subunit [Bacillus sp. FJAT-45037]|uniref:dihydroorotate dehydrogenase electron transfer subunit n=1 Tax=Bacillus sp. FJAT-45037 TaxID=2011007 RepID=UPI000C23C752|nr:dihydroorotate dehydrogenase electron transfer subunit [Bacillus sp. FJAT-45037]